MKRPRKNLKKRSGRTILSLLLAAALAVGGMTTAFATEEDPSADAAVTEEAVEADADGTSVNTDKLNAAVSVDDEDAYDTDDTLGAGDGQESGEGDASAVGDAASSHAADADNTEDSSATSAFSAVGQDLTDNPDYDPSYGLYGGYDGQDSMDDPEKAGACVGWDIATRAAVTADSGLWWVDDYYVGESSLYDVEETDDFSLKYQVEFHASEDLEVGAVQIVIDASLGTYRDGTNILPTDIGIPYGTPDNYTTSSSSPFNYYYIDADGNILTEDEAKTAEGVQLVIWNYKDIVSGSNAMFQVLYKDLDVMQIPDMTDWELSVTVSVDENGDGEPTETVDGNALSGVVDTTATLTSVTKRAYTYSLYSYTPELYTQSQVSSYIHGDIPEPYASEFDDYIYIVWYVTLNGTATQAYEITIDEDTFSDGGSGSVVGYKVYTSSTSYEVSSSYGTDADGNPTLTFSSSTERSFSAAFYVVTAYDAATYEEDTEIENDVAITVHPVDGQDEDTTKSASATTTWSPYVWGYSGNGISIRKWQRIVLGTYEKTGIFQGNRYLYEINSENGVDTGEYSYSTESTDRGYAYTHATSGDNMGEWIEGSYYTTTTVDDALYVYLNGETDPSRMLTKEDYYFSSVKIQTTDNGYDVWEDRTTDPTDYDGVDQDVYIYAMYYDVQEGAADDDGWEYVATVPFSTSESMTYTFTEEDLARQPYRVKAVHSTADYVTYCRITIGLTLRHDSPTIQWCYDYCEENGIDLDTIEIENLSGVAGQTYHVPGYEDGTYFQSTEGDYSEKDTVTEETLAEFTKDLYGTILERDEAYVILNGLEETSASYKNVTTENDAENARVLANYYITSYEAYYVTGESSVTAFKEAGSSLPERHEVSYYDLLPYGMQFNPSATVTAGRITSMNSSGSWKTNTGAWSKDGVTVKVDDDDVITNWNGTGRTMVIFHIYYDGDDASAFYDVPNSDEDLWYQGFAISFQAYYDWADLNSVDEEANIAAYIAEGVTDETEQFLGQHDSTVYKDDGSAELASQYAPFMGVSDLNGDGVTDLYTNMYASTGTSTNIATASSDSIKKLVRADDDAVAEYGSTAIVGNGRGYTYEVLLTNIYGGTLSDIVLYDRLEYSVEDGQAEVETGADSVFNGLSPDEINNHWTGTFSSVTLTGFTDVGIEPVVYYSADRDAPISENGEEEGTSKTTPTDVLTEANGWYTQERFIEVYGSLSEAKAIAVDISKTTSGEPFLLEPGDSLSYQIHMTAPEEVAEGSIYAFNNPSYYSVSTSVTGDTTSSTNSGSTVRTELGDAGTLEVEKEFDHFDNVPESLQNTSFTFEVRRDGEVLANQEYRVYEWDGEDWVSTGVIKATDINGLFTLKAGQKAVFTRLVNVDEVTVSEVSSVLWITEVNEDRSQETDAENPALYYTFTNTYHSPVYLYKTARTTDLASDEELADATFTFLLEVDTDGDGEYEPYVGEYVYVTNALTDGSSPAIDPDKGEDGYGYTQDGYVTLQLGDIIAFYPCDADGNYIDVAYRIVESALSEDGDWVCFDDTTTGTTSDYGMSETITNYYKYRSLILTKDLSDYDQDLSDCDSEWTFQLKMYDPENDGADEDGYILVVGAHWYMIDENGDALGVEGYTDDQGEFSFAGAGSGRRVVVEDLVEGESYTVTEVDYNTELYETVNGGTADATMPTYAISRSVTLTNKYLLKDLAVSKLVLSRDTSADVSTREFTFTLEKYDSASGGYEPAAEVPYTIEGGDGTVLYTDENGQFTLTSGQTALFDDIGYMDDVYRITETPDDDYPQIYPDGSYDAKLGSDGDSIQFVNGDFSNVASLTKNLVGLDEVGEAYVDIVEDDNTAATLAGVEGDVPYTVEVTFGVYDGEDCVTEAEGALTDFVSDNADYPYVYIKIFADGSYELKSYNGGEMTVSLAPYDYIYIAELGECTVKASESVDMERVLLDVTDDAAEEIGSDEILSEGDVMSGSAAANENIVLVNNISSANKASEIYKLMTETSEEVPAGSQITFLVEVYDAATGTWSPASGIKYITMDGYTGEGKTEDGVTYHDTSDCWPTSGVLTTGSDGKITLTKTDNDGYPYIRFVEDVVYANVYDDAADGTLRIVEAASGTDDAWGLLVGYDGEGWVGGPALDITYADTFYNGNDETMQFEVEKEMVDDAECDDDFTFYLRQVLSASTSPITSMDEILDSETGADVYYILYDVESGQRIGDGYTDANGAFTLKPGQYAVFNVPEDTTWYVYEGVNLGYPLYDVTANWDAADNASIVDETNGVVQNASTAYATGTIILTLTDADEGTPLAGGTFDLYKDGALVQSGLVTDKNGQIIVADCVPGEYYFKETASPSNYSLPDEDTSETVTIPEGLTKVTEYPVSMENTSAAVKYAVKLWGICADTYSYDEGDTTATASLTFGPAAGADHLKSHVECDSDTCIHKLSWDEIIDYCNQYQGNETMLTSLFGSCLEHGCTKAVELTPNEKLFNMTTVENYLGQNYTGDGVSTLANLLNYSSSNGAYGCWNENSDNADSDDRANVYSRSRIRTTLIGDSTNIEEQLAAGGNNYYYTADHPLLDESNCLFSCFPENLQAAVVPRTTRNTENATTPESDEDKTTYDKLFLFSQRETDISSDSDDASGDNYGLFHSNDERVVYEFNSTAATTSGGQFWWTRSGHSDRPTNAYYINYYGVVGNENVYNACGLSPGFCIK